MADNPRSGRVLVRMPATLHDELAWAAASEHVSLNQFICNVLAGALQWRAPEAARPHPRSSEELVQQMWRDILG